MVLAPRMADRPRATRPLALGLALTMAATSAHGDPPDPRITLLERDATHARIWWWGFTLTYAVVASAETVLALTLEDPGLRIDAAVGAGSAWLGVGGMIISPIPNVWRANEASRTTASFDASFARAVKAETDGRAWYNHAACAAVALAAGAILWIGYDRPGSAIFNFASNLVVGEVNLFTQPGRAMRYRDRPLALRVAPMLNGVQLVGAW